MITSEQVSIIRNATSKYEPSLIGVFGSFARNENTPESDLDILIDFNHKINLLDLIGLEQELTELLQIKVDLVTVKSLHSRLEGLIKKELIQII